jgi:hypothetical protein
LISARIGTGKQNSEEAARQAGQTMTNYSNVTNQSKSSQLVCRPLPVFNDKEKAAEMLVTAGPKPDLVSEHKIVE